MPTEADTPKLSREDRIREIAYAIWEEEGHPDGRHDDHWLRACAIADGEDTPDPDWLKRDVDSAIDDLSKRVARPKAA
ncbi:DUF2934 domain-containing protein [Aestuariivirga sp.]|uniref:DUF2934 domain-containing protein n=1 Tax=Aestuariivirga sp. TaxID=2650926 RepID=UPI0039E2E2FF